MLLPSGWSQMRQMQISLVVWLPSPKTNSLPLKKGLPKRKGSSCDHEFSGANILVSGRAITLSTFFEPSLGRPRSFENQSI